MNVSPFTIYPRIKPYYIFLRRKKIRTLIAFTGKLLLDSLLLFSLPFALLSFPTFLGVQVLVAALSSLNTALIKPGSRKSADNYCRNIAAPSRKA